MKTHILTAARQLPVLAIFLLISFSMANGGTLSHTFENQTGRTAYDLHIKYNRQAKIISQDPEAFDKVNDGGDDGKNIVDLSEGSVANGNSVKIKAQSKTGDLKINTWWWTDKDHNRIGDIHDGCNASDGCMESGAGDSMGAVSSAFGLTNVVFDLPQAKITVYLPDDIVAGDTISGTVLAEPKPGYVQDNSPNSETLTGVVVDLGDKQTVSVCNPCSALRSFVLPHVFEQKGRLMNVSLSQPGRSPIKAAVPIQPSAVLSTTDPNIPPFAQTGRPATITGPFDGNSGNTQCTVGTQQVAILAESPRKAIFRTPSDITGPVKVSVTDNGKTSTGDMRILSVKLSSPKTNLTGGEKTNVHMEIKGLKGERRGVPLRVVTTGSANTQGGNVQDITIMPGQIRSDGTFVRNFALTGTSTGVFSVTATVNVPNLVGAAKGCECFCELNKNPIVTAGKQAKAGGAQHSFTPNIAKVACNGNQCSIAKTEYKWSVGKGSTATYTITGGIDDAETISIDVTKKGTVELTVTVTVKCSDGSTCSATGTKTFTLDTK